MIQKINYKFNQILKKNLSDRSDLNDTLKEYIYMVEGIILFRKYFDFSIINKMLSFFWLLGIK